MRANAPTSKEGTIAWQLASQPGLWMQTAIAGVASSALVTQGLRMEAALEQARTLYPGASLFHIHICLEHIEAARLKVEAKMRARPPEAT